MRVKTKPNPSKQLLRRAKSIFNYLKTIKCPENGLTRQSIASVFRWDVESTYKAICFLIKKGQIRPQKRGKRTFYSIISVKEKEKWKKYPLPGVKND